MTKTSMQNYGFTWTDPDGTKRASAVAYDRTSADRQKQKLEASGCTSVEVVPVRPGELPKPKV
ncbi:hypothetical protein [Streptomyces sp. BBFR109]|uniref:hypothetical protein n=1 Tax=Streptomyces sp. BBFR109 TaxID=3448172 RepID=UPI003F769DA9